MLVSGVLPYSLPDLVISRTGLWSLIFVTHADCTIVPSPVAFLSAGHDERSSLSVHACFYSCFRLFLHGGFFRGLFLSWPLLRLLLLVVLVYLVAPSRDAVTGAPCQLGRLGHIASTSFQFRLCLFLVPFKLRRTLDLV